MLSSTGCDSYCNNEHARERVFECLTFIDEWKIILEYEPNTWQIMYSIF